MSNAESLEHRIAALEAKLAAAETDIKDICVALAGQHQVNQALLANFIPPYNPKEARLVEVLLEALKCPR
jgi:hypothetical protein